MQIFIKPVAFISNMNIKKLVQIVFICIFLASSVSAMRTETKEDGTTAYFTDEGRLISAFNPGKMTQVLGAGNWEVDPVGMLIIIETSVSGIKREIGVLSGTIITDVDNYELNVQNGAYGSASSYADPIKIGGEFIMHVINKREITVEIIKGYYQQRTYFYGCTSEPDCHMGAVITPEKLSLNIKGEAFLSSNQGEDNTNLFIYTTYGYERLKAKVDEAKSTGEYKKLGVTPLYGIKEINDIELLDIDPDTANDLFSITAMPQQDAEFNGQEIYTEYPLWITDMTGEMELFYFREKTSQ